MATGQDSKGPRWGASLSNLFGLWASFRKTHEYIEAEGRRDSVYEVGLKADDLQFTWQNSERREQRRHHAMLAASSLGHRLPAHLAPCHGFSLQTLEPASQRSACTPIPSTCHQ